MEKQNYIHFDELFTYNLVVLMTTRSTLIIIQTIIIIQIHRIQNSIIEQILEIITNLKQKNVSCSTTSDSVSPSSCPAINFSSSIHQCPYCVQNRTCFMLQLYRNKLSFVCTHLIIRVFICNDMKFIAFSQQSCSMGFCNTQFFVFDNQSYVDI